MRLTAPMKQLPFGQQLSSLGPRDGSSRFGVGEDEGCPVPYLRYHKPWRSFECILRNLRFEEIAIHQLRRQQRRRRQYSPPISVCRIPRARFKSKSLGRARIHSALALKSHAAAKRVRLERYNLKIHSTFAEFNGINQ